MGCCYCTLPLRLQLNHAGKRLVAMLFPTFAFAVFFAVVMTVGWMLHSKPVAWKLFMIAASYLFYAWWNPRFVLLIAASTIVNTVCGRAIYSANTHASNLQTPTASPLSTASPQSIALQQSQRLRKIALIVAVVFNLTILGVFKYYDFFISSVEDGLEQLGLAPNLPLLRVVLPVGISFFTFQALSYVIDVYRGKVAATNLLQFAVYLAFFPQLVAGPIVRASEFLPQLERRLNPREIDFTRGAMLIALGLFKKVVIASYLADALVDDVFAFPERFSGAEILLGVYGYAIQIYADFSGYTDIAIGVALLLGFRFPENFNQPYRATSIADFWRRWHMTLSRWLRDYLYIPLGGNRGGKAKRDRNLFLTMLLGGLWHGAAWPFVIWGAYQGGGLMAERRLGEWTGRRRERRTDDLGKGRRGERKRRQPDVPQSDHGWGEQPARTALRWLATFHFICLGWVFFRSETLSDAGSLLSQLFGSFLSPAPDINAVFVGVVVCALLAQMLSRQALADAQTQLSRLPAWALAVGFGIWMLVVDQFGPEGVAPFIYFQF